MQVILDGLWAGLLYGLIAAGLSLIWGVMDVLNFAHGDFLMIGMYVSFFLGFLFKLDPLVSWIASGAFLFLVGMLTYKLIISRVLGKAMAPLLATFGLSMLIKNFILNRFSPNFRILETTILEGRSFMIGDVIIPLPQFVTSIFSLAVLGLLYGMITRTRCGWVIQATALD